MTTYSESYGIVMAIINTAWTASGAVTEDVPLQFEDTGQSKVDEDPVDSSQAGSYARVFVRTIFSEQTTIGRRRFGSVATVTVQIFTPFGKGGTAGREMADVVLAALRGHTGSVSGVAFFDVEPIEVGRDGAHFHINAGGSFTYQESI